MSYQVWAWSQVSLWIRRWPVTGISCAALLCCFFGWSSGSNENPDWPKRYKVSGTVNYQSKPVDGAVVTFLSKDGKSTATGKTDSGGRFNLTTFVERDGAVAGEHSVTIYAAKVVDNTPKDVDLSAGGKAGTVTTTWIVPEKYSIPSKSGLNASVNEQGPNDFNFDLK